MKTRLAAACLLLAFAAVFLPVWGHAQDRPSVELKVPSDPNAPIKKSEDALGVVVKFVEYIGIIFWIFAAASAFYAAYLYLFAGGNPEMLKRAQKQLWYTIIAIVIGLMAIGLPALIKNLISPGGGSVQSGRAHGGPDDAY
jgi:hypothetical protein